MSNVVYRRLKNFDTCYEVINTLLYNYSKNTYQLKESLSFFKNKLFQFIINYNDVYQHEVLNINNVFGNMTQDAFSYSNLKLEAIDLFFIYNTLHQLSLDSKDVYNPNKDSLSGFNSRKTNGSFYTPYSIAYYMVKKTILNYFNDNTHKSIQDIKILEPCLGTGVFIVAFVDYLLEDESTQRFNTSKELVINLLKNNTVFVDVDVEALNFFKIYMPFHLKYYFDIDFDFEHSTKHFFEDDILLSNKIIQNYKNYFDIIFFNPPYELLKPNSNEFKLNDGNIDHDAFNFHYSNTQKLKSYFKNNNAFEFSRKGMLNLYKLFIELTVKSLSNSKCSISFIVPLTLLGDYQCKELRQYLLSNNKLCSVVLIPEKNVLFNNISQAFTIMNLSKELKTNKIEIKDNVKNTQELFTDDFNTVNYDTLKKLSQNKIITSLTNDDEKIIQQLSNTYKICELKKYILNLRGEIDLTKYKSYINSNQYGAPLVRGGYLGYYLNIYNNQKLINFDHIDDHILDEPQFDLKRKLSHSYEKRIACPQISNMNTTKRLKFSFINEGFYLANSCNYLLITNMEHMESQYGITYESLLCLLNSSIYNYIFKLTSTNNHISNNQIGDLPLLLNSDKKWVYINLKNIFIKYINGYITLRQTEMYVDANVFYLFDIQSSQIKYLLNKEGRSIKYIEDVIDLKDELPTSVVYNHQICKLSDLDLKMIKSVPPGGNWKHIPLDVPSKRLEQIRNSGGRSTLYGRLARNMPSYTISTYYNRPGNGTFIHPDYYNDSNGGYTQNRLISHREAARLQSFKDNFIFTGSNSSILKQIGNAVPPILSYHLAKSIIQYFSNRNLNVIDLFCGAGGLSYGFKEAGCNISLAIDNDKDSIATFQKNHEDSCSIHGDIQNYNIKQTLYNTITDKHVDIIIGGPPCQGYSQAGLRIIDDPRNYLFREFVTLVDMKKPSMFLIENVTGLLSINSGKTYKSIIQCFADIGYNVVGKTLNAAEFGVPQRRKRVFIVGSKSHIDDNIFPNKSFALYDMSKKKQLSLFDSKLPRFTTVEEAISDLPIISKDLGAYKSYTPFPNGISHYQYYMKDLISFEQFYQLKKEHIPN